MQVIEQLRQLSPERFESIYETLARDGFGPLDGEVAKLMKFRPHMIRKVPFAQRARRARTIMEQAGNAEMCYELFGTYLFAAQKQLVLDFLDGTGVEHEDGLTHQQSFQHHKKYCVKLMLSMGNLLSFRSLLSRIMSICSGKMS